MTEDRKSKGDKGQPRTWHLADSAHENALVNFEFTQMQLGEAFRRWCLQISRAIGDFEMGFNELVILHVVRMQDRAKDATTIANLLNRDDIPNVQYSLRKLVSAKLLSKHRVGSNFVFTTTDLGRKSTEAYSVMRRQLLTVRTGQVSDVDDKLIHMTETMSLLTGIYDAAARAAATYWPGDPMLQQDAADAPVEAASPVRARSAPPALKIAKS